MPMQKNSENPQTAGKLDHQKLIPVEIKNVTIDDLFWSPKLKTIREVMVNDVFTKFENDRGGAINNFDKVVRGEKGGHAGPPWYDGLIGECIRGTSDMLAYEYDQALDNRLDGYIERIAAAQAADPDGYLNTWVSLESPNTRWGKNGGNILWQHDVYDAGCLIEAGVHHYRATGKVNMLQVAVTFANHMVDLMGPPPRENIVPAHSLPEEAVINLYKLFKEEPNLKAKFAKPIDEQKYLELVKFWINQRGNTQGRRDMGEYSQDHKSVIEHESIVGHAVRAGLLYTGVTAAAMASGDTAYFKTVQKVWENAVNRRMYITGGVGSYHHDEKFGADFDLPNDGYLETCASVAMAFWHHNMNLAFGEAKYIDELERVLYNGILVGISQKGTEYFYTNPLSCSNHDRWDWHGCPCCPPMLLKTFGSLPSYIYAYDDEGIYINLFIGGTADIPLKGNVVRVKQETKFPWNGEVKVTLASDASQPYPLFIRVPVWARGKPIESDLYDFVDKPKQKLTYKINGTYVEPEIVKGYARFARKWKTGDEIEFILPLETKRIKSHAKVRDNLGKVSLVRGPVVYCLEDVDNNNNVDRIYITKDTLLTSGFEDSMLGGVVAITGESELRGTDVNEIQTTPFTAIPYYAQNNRDSGTMSVWLPTGEIPEFSPESSIFIDEQIISLSASFKDYDIYYTLDGSDPTLHSSKYENPFTVNAHTTVKARSFGKDGGTSEIVSAKYSRVKPRKPDDPAKLVKGLQVDYYKGSWKVKVPDIETLKPLKTNNVKSLDITFAKKDKDFMVVFKGYLEVTADGIYTFFLKSEGPSSLSIGDVELAGSKGSSGMEEISSKIALAEGKHKIQAIYCQRGGGTHFTVSFEGPGIKKGAIPETSLFSGK